MAEIVSVLDLDMSDYASYPVIHAQQYDEVTRQLKIRLYENGQAYNLSTGVTVHIVGKKVAMIDDSIEIPDDPETLERLGISIKGVILESTPAIIQFNLTQALLVSGIKKMKVVITTYENEQVLTRISSIPFYIRVEDECAREAEEYGSGCSLGSIYPYRLLDNSKSLTAINSSKGDIENYQQLFDEPDAEREYVTNHVNARFGFTLNNWLFDIADKFEYICKFNSGLTSRHWIITNTTGNSSPAKFIIEWAPNANLRLAFNVKNVSDVYQDGDGGFNYYYKIVYDCGMITLYRGESLNDISTQVYQHDWDVSEGVDDSKRPRILYGGIGWDEGMDCTIRLYGIKVWDSQGTLLHNYVPYTYGMKDKVTNEIFQMDTPVPIVNYVNGPVVS